MPEERRLTGDEFRDVIGHFASGVTIVTATERDAPLGTTASAVCSLSLEPPMVVVCMNRTSKTGQAIARVGRFAINVLAEHQQPLARHFASKDPDKFAGLGTTAGATGAPLLDEAVAHLECVVTDEVEGGTHTVFLAEVQAATAHGGEPLAYFRGEFTALKRVPSNS
jgi:flavin reductase (DIM6/NTAB) family NADH-FMN oxidoreductase RutF